MIVIVSSKITGPVKKEHVIGENSCTAIAESLLKMLVPGFHAGPKAFLAFNFLQKE